MSNLMEGISNISKKNAVLDFIEQARPSQYPQTDRRGSWNSVLDTKECFCWLHSYPISCSSALKHLCLKLSCSKWVDKLECRGVSRYIIVVGHTLNPFSKSGRALCYQNTKKWWGMSPRPHPWWHPCTECQDGLQWWCFTGQASTYTKWKRQNQAFKFETVW